MNDVKDLIGVTWGDLTVVAYYGSAKKQTLWLCQCTCGNTVIRTRSSIWLSIHKNHHGHCGCKSSSLRRGKNDWSFDDSFAYCKLNKGYTTKIDLEDYERVKDYHWFTTCLGYAYAHITINGKETQVTLHRLIMDCPDGMVVDHINHDKLDNRKCNLRICTQQQNSWNRNRSLCHNKTGYCGVSYDSRKNRYYASIERCGKKRCLGGFSTAEEAYEARLKAEQFYDGEYASD